MPGSEYVGMHSPYARGDASTAHGVASELTTIAATANGAAADVGLTTNGQALLRAATDLSRIGGTVNGRATLLDGYLINMGLATPSGGGDPFGAYGPFMAGDPGQQTQLTPVLQQDYANLTPSQIAEYSLLPNMDGAVIDRVELTVSASVGDWGGGLELFVETQTKDGAPTIARIGGTFDVEQDVTDRMRERLGLTKAYTGEVELFREYVLPPGTSTEDLVAGLESHLALAEERPSFANLGSAIATEGSPAALGLRAQIGDDKSWSSEDFFEGILPGPVESFLPVIDGARTRDASIEFKAYGEGVAQIRLEGLIGVDGRAEGPYNLVHGEADAGAGGAITVLSTPGVTHVLVDLIATQGHGGGAGVAVTTPPTMGTQAKVSFEQSRSGDDLGRIVTSTYWRLDGSGDPYQTINTQLTGDELTRTGSLEIDVRDGVEVSISKTSSQTKVEQMPTHGIEPWGDHYDLPPTEPPVYDKYGRQPPAPPADSNDIYLPIVGAGGSDSEPSEIYLPIVGASGPAAEPEPSLIQDMPPLEREGLYLQEPELIYNPGQERETYIVEEGDNFWYMAEEMTTLANGGEPVSDAEFSEYWNELQELNYDNLQVEGNPDLIWAGQEMMLPGEVSEPTWHLRPQ